MLEFPYVILTRCLFVAVERERIKRERRVKTNKQAVNVESDIFVPLISCSRRCETLFSFYGGVSQVGWFRCITTYLLTLSVPNYLCFLSF